MVWTRYRIQIQDDNVVHSGSCWCFKLLQYIFYKPTLRCPVTYWLTLDCKKTKRKIAFICQAIVPHGRRALLIACSFIVSNSHILELTFFFTIVIWFRWLKSFSITRHMYTNRTTFNTIFFFWFTRKGDPFLITSSNVSCPQLNLIITIHLSKLRYPQKWVTSSQGSTDMKNYLILVRKP